MCLCLSLKMLRVNGKRDGFRLTLSQIDIILERATTTDFSFSDLMTIASPSFFGIIMVAPLIFVHVCFLSVCNFPCVFFSLPFLLNLVFHFSSFSDYKFEKYRHHI